MRGACKNKKTTSWTVHVGETGTADDPICAIDFSSTFVDSAVVCGKRKKTLIHAAKVETAVDEEGHSSSDEALIIATSSPLTSSVSKWNIKLELH